MVSLQPFPTDSETWPVLGILCAGGPAPGLNGVIAGATRYALRLHWKVIGILEGFRYLMTGDADLVKKHTVDLTLDVVNNIEFLGGTIIMMARGNPKRNEETLENVRNSIRSLKIRYFMVIGGDGSASNAVAVAAGFKGDISVIACPKTIDNDLPLPNNESTFGYETARAVGAKVVHNLQFDARGSPKWFICESMGRGSGHLALGIAVAAGADLCLIPEEFKADKIEFEDLVDIIESSMLKRLAYGKNYGVVVVAEGLISKMTMKGLHVLFGSKGVKLDPEGNIVLDEADLSQAICDELYRRIRHLGLRVFPKKIGYELRCAKPICSDVAYTLQLGWGAVEAFKNGDSHALIVRQNGKIGPIPFDSIVDKVTGRVEPRLVNINDPSYKIARQLMWRMNRKDWGNYHLVNQMGKVSKTDPQELKARLARIVSLTHFSNEAYH